ncbi:MAG TPA: dihydrofolate reductase [Devosia sp.]|jgi:dihydrofolate reductase|nr:dihydrofolate reductase [Devosia sp.]
MSVAVALIAAVAANGVIGSGNAIPWYLPSDFAHFKRMTRGKPLIMGRKTFESIGRPLPGRTNIIVSRQEGYQPDGVIVISSLEAALEHAQSIANDDRANEVMIGGGAEIYSQALPIADRLYITHVGLEPVGDAYFPSVTQDQWVDGGLIDVRPDPRDTAAFRIRVYRRRPNSRR